MNAPITAQPDPSPVVAAFLKKPPRLLIDGKWVPSSSGKTLAVIDPATGGQIATIADADASDCDRAVKAARKAFEEGPWATMKPNQRQGLLWKLADLVEQHADELAEIESLDNGKTKLMARYVDVAGVVDNLRYMAGWATKIEGHTLDLSASMAPGDQYHAYTKREPIGVCVQIVPWNFPLLMAAMKISPALATGNTCILKPAEQTSLSTLRFAELIQEAGFPDGVVNIITGLGETAGAALVEHPDVDKIAFTGSTPVGKLIQKSASDTLKRVSLELGGKSPVIMFPDCDPEMAAGGAANAIFFNHGQVCVAGSRLYVHKKIFDDVVGGVVDHAAKIKLGPGLAPDTGMGPLVSDEQQDRVLGYIASARQEGASVATGGERAGNQGYYVQPTVLVNARPDMRVVREEIFGPVVVAQRFEDINEVAKAANDTPYGLAASVWTKDLSTAHRLVPKLRAGTVWVNTHSIMDMASPFGGYKQSGYGRENGRTACEMYTELKTVIMSV